MTLFLLLSLACLLSIGSATIDPTQGSKLLLIVETFRHGARQRIFNTSDFESSNSNDFGEITAQGLRMHYVLGQTLRTKYANSDIAFPKTYNPSFLFAQSTDTNRTILSCKAQLAGMFPQGFAAQSLSTVDSNYIVPPFVNLNQNGLDEYALTGGQQPIPVHTGILSQDKQLLGFGSPCTNQKTWIARNKNGSDYERIHNLFKPTIDRIAAIPEMKLPQNPKLDVIAQLVDTLISVKWSNRTEEKNKLNSLIDGYNFTEDQMIDVSNRDVFWVQLNLIYSIEKHLALFNTKQQRTTSITPYFNELLAYFNNALTETNYFKWIMLSAHDSTLSMVLQGMNQTSWECIEQYVTGSLPTGAQCELFSPAYASSFIFELYKDSSNKPFIKALYNGIEISLCNSEQKYCYLDTFSSLVANQIVESYDKECGNLIFADPVQEQTYEWAIGVIWILSGLLATSIVFIFIQRRQFLMSKLQMIHLKQMNQEKVKIISGSAKSHEHCDIIS